MTSSRPYLLRALYEWIVDNGMTPYLLVDAQKPQVQVPTQYIENGKIVLNVGPLAVQRLDLANDYVTFSARFAGTPMEVVIPVGATLAIYAKETGQGMVFNEEEGESPPPSPESPPPTKPRLKVVK